MRAVDDDGCGDEAWIPCELCDTLIRFRDYAVHIENCGADGADDEDEDDEAVVMPFLVGAAAAANLNIVVRLPSHQQLPNDARDGIDTTSRPPQNVLSVIFNGRSRQNAPADRTYDTFLSIAEMIGNVEHGMPDIDACIDRLHADTASAFTPDTACPVCQEPISALMAGGTPVVKLRACDHVFCDACIRTWLERKTRCPICMVDLRCDAEGGNTGGA